MKGIIVIWILVGIVNYSATVAYFSRQYPQVKQLNSDRVIGVVMGLGGPFTFPTVLFNSGFYKHGFRF